MDGGRGSSARLLMKGELAFGLTPCRAPTAPPEDLIRAGIANRADCDSRMVAWPPRSRLGDLVTLTAAPACSRQSCSSIVNGRCELVLDEPSCIPGLQSHFFCELQSSNTPAGSGADVIP